MKFFYFLQMEHIFKRNLSIGFGLSFLILLLSTVASYVSIDKLINNLRLVNSTNSIISELESVISTLKDAETGQRGYLLSGDREFLDPYNGAEYKIANTFVSLRELIKDDPIQLADADYLERMINERVKYLSDLIDLKKTNKPFTIVELRSGKQKMDEVRRVVRIMEGRAKLYLVPNTKKLNLFADYTPVVIVIAALLAMLITIIFYSRVKKDFETRMALQRELKKNEQHLNKRINIIQHIATKISAGNYNARIDDEEKDALGTLADSLNTMAGSLQYSFDLLMEKEWMQSGIAELNEKMIDETDMHSLCRNIVGFVSTYINSQVGTIYIMEEDGILVLTGAYAFVDDGTRKVIKLGEGLIGESALSGEQKLLKQIENTDISINFASGQIKPKNVIALPIFYERKLKGVIELATVNDFSNKEISFLSAILKDIGIGINSVQNRTRFQLLLQQTQSQKEELHAQHVDLQEVNAELELNTANLRASETLLKVQQDELVQANQELEARACMLEERTKTILERNIEIQEKSEQLRLSAQYKSEFLTNMSHELRTPLNSVLLLSGLMANNKDGKLSEEYIEFSKVIHNSGKGLLALIDEILDLSKIESGKMDLYYEPVQIKEMVQNMNGLFKEVANQKGIDLIISIAAEVPSTIETDQMRLEQVIKNLLSNALKFTSSGGSVELAVFKPIKENDCVGFSVKDTGIGISEEKHQLIFEAFQQADGSTQRKYGGTGLGLSISRQLIKLLGGEITLTSEPGKGSEFSIFIPCAKPAISEPSAQMEVAKDNPQANIQPLEQANKEMTEYLMEDNVVDDREEVKAGDKSILIVEDDIMLARLILSFTREIGWKGIVALKGNEGLELAKKCKPSGILLDIKVPVKNGWQVLEELKHDPSTSSIPTYTMSSNNLKKESMEYGAAGFINKPISFEKITGAFRTISRVHSYKKEKVLIVESNRRHAKALANYLGNSNIKTGIKHDVQEGIESLSSTEVECMILCIDGTVESFRQNLERARKKAGLDNLPAIILAGQNLSDEKESQQRKFADVILSGTNQSYKRILNKVAFFLQIENIEQPAGQAENNARFSELAGVLKDKVVLIADDDIRNIFSVTKSLELLEMRVLSALDGKEALSLLKSNPDVDIILMDIMMPEMDGFEAISKIVKDPEVNEIPIIGLTAMANKGDREKVLEAGASDYISKPVDIDKLLSLLRIWLYEIQIKKARMPAAV